MGTTIGVVVGVVVAVGVLVFVGWHLGSRRYSIPCPAWLRWMVELDNPFTKTNRADAILDCSEIQPGMHVLDVGCGPGRLSIPAALRVGNDGRVVALDLQQGMLDRVRDKAEAAGVGNIEIVRAAAGDHVLGQQEYDRVLLVTVLGEIPDRPAAMRDVFEALKPGGLLTVTEVIFDPHFQRRSTVLRLAGEAGFCPKAVHGNSIAYTMILERPTNGQ